MRPTEVELVTAIESATKAVIDALFAQHNESFYYICLLTSGEAARPVFSAWSTESLVREFEQNSDTRIEDLKWSGHDSPYYGFGDEFFTSVAEIFERRPQIDSFLFGDDGWEAWRPDYELRLRAMESALALLDGLSVFGEGHQRTSLYINVEVIPPDYTNTERAKRLNPNSKVLTDWLDEAAED